MGMLRSGAESELVKTLDYHAAGGTIQVDGQPCTLTKYRVQANYQVPGYRTQIECTRPNKQTYSNVETVSGEYAWDEDIPGAELVPGKGKATPRPAALQERLIRLWASPHGAPKAAIAGAAGLPPSESFGQNPAVLLDRQAAAGAKATTTLSWQGEKAVVTFPIPGVPGATATATLDANYLPERVVVTHGTNKTEFVYGNFADWNNPLFKIEALYAGTIVERQNGTVVRRREGEGDRNRPGVRRHAGSGQCAEGCWKVRIAMKAIHGGDRSRPPRDAAGSAGAGAARSRTPRNAPTPRLASGKPDLTGSWQGAGGGLQGFRRRHVPAVHAVPVEAVHGVDQSERGLGVHVGHAAR